MQRLCRVSANRSSTRIADTAQGAQYIRHRHPSVWGKALDRNSLFQPRTRLRVPCHPAMSEAIAPSALKHPVTDRVREAMAVSLRGCEELLPEDGLARQARPRRSHRGSPAHQARPRPHGARHSSRPHRGAQQDAPTPGSRPHGHLPDRRLHVDDRRPVGPQHHAPAADARADRNQRADLLQAGQPGARPGPNRDPLQLRMERSAGCARHDPARLALHGGADDGAQRFRRTLPGRPADLGARVAVPADAGLRLGGAEVATSNSAAPTRSSICWSGARCRPSTARSRSAS